MRAPLLVALFLCALLAGCSSDPAGEAAAPAADFSDLDLEATSSTGVIRGVVVDEAIRPLADAAVTLRGDQPRTSTTKDDGAFGFDGLQPGTYFLSIHKAGYLDVQQSADVAAGVAEPPAVKVQLRGDGKPAPYAVAYTVEGLIECSIRTPAFGLALCGAPHDAVQILCTTPPLPCPPQPTNDAYSAFLQLDGGTPDYVQTEMAWESTQATGADMSYALRYAERSTYNQGMYEGGFDSFSGTSPLLGHVSGDDAADAELGNRTGLVFSIFAGAGTYPVGLTLEQRYTFYIHTFYGYTPPEGWRFSTDGTVPPPQ
jgi:hypothetical protein